MSFRLALLAASLLLAACATTATTLLPTADTMDYRLARGDRIRIEVIREPSLSGEFVVNEAGRVGLPRVGQVEAAGKTAAQLRAELEATLARSYVRDAQVNLDIVSYPPIYILGEVERPGEYAYVDRMSVLALVAKAGGFTYRANRGVVFVRHAQDGAEAAYRLTSGAAVLPGDTIRIEERTF